MSAAMQAPLLATGSIGVTQALWLALPIGVAFGAVLERAGLADPRKLAAQFTLTDLTVFKVMMTAIATAAAGLFWLGRAGLVDLALVQVPPTFIVPQIAGGLIFGVGFVIGGYCPGTSCVAAAAGRGDALALIGGMLAGTLAFGEAFETVHEFYHATSMGEVTWYGLAGMSHGAAVALLVGGALLAFGVAERIERGRNEAAPPRTARRGMIVAATITVALATATAGRRSAPSSRPPEPAAPEIPDSTTKPAHVPDWESPIQC